jgi:hypothetical protein
MDAVMAFRNHLSAMRRQRSDSLSKVPQAKPKARKLCSFHVDNMPAYGKEGKA